MTIFFGHWSLKDREGQEAENSRHLEVIEKVEEKEGAGCLSTQEGGGSDEQDFSHFQ